MIWWSILFGWSRHYLHLVQRIETKLENQYWFDKESECGVGIGEWSIDGIECECVDEIYRSRSIDSLQRSEDKTQIYTGEWKCDEVGVQTDQLECMLWIAEWRT